MHDSPETRRLGPTARYARAVPAPGGAPVAPAALALVALLVGGCGRRVSARARATSPLAARATHPALRPEIRVGHVETRFETAPHMLAGIEMQLSGEPLAETMGRSLAGYDRNALRPDRYAPPGAARSLTDLAGYAAAVESYEYSKQPMNNLAFESGAGTALAFGPVLSPGSPAGRPAQERLRALVQRLAIATHAGVRAPPGTVEVEAQGFVTIPARAVSPINSLGFPGLWPTMYPFRAFDPRIAPSGNGSRGCTLAGDEESGAVGATHVADYECSYVSLHLPDRDAQTDRVLTVGATGFAAWKYGLWIANYLKLFHDSSGAPVATVAAADQSRVGTERNGVRGALEGGAQGAEGTWLGSSPLEGLQAGVMIESLQNQAQHVLGALTTTDGAHLSGFASLGDALAYDYVAPLRWVPGAVAVSEVPDPEARFPRPTSFAIREAHAPLLDQLGLLAGYAELFALTDHANPDVGGAPTARAYFDGEPFADDDARVNGDASPHDRWLAMLKLALVSLDRLYARPDDLFAGTTSATAAGAVQRGAALSTYDAAYAVVALRTARRALAGRLTLYSDARPDGATTRTALDGTRWRGAPGGASPAQRLTALIEAHARVLYDRLTDGTGRAVAGWDHARGVAAGDGDLEAHAAAVRGLLEAYLATGDTRYRARARRVFERLEADFYDARTAMYFQRRDRASAEATRWTPRRFGVLQGALREIYKLLGTQPGAEALAARVASRFARLGKLVLNGWNDRDGDDEVDYPAECVRVEGGVPRGGLQMAERALSGELGVEQSLPTTDRDHDCVPEIDDVGLPAALAAELRFELPR